MNYQRINQALEYAAEMHNDLRYKYDHVKFQVAHIFFVGAVLIRYGFSDDVIIAGILHDVVEDTKAEAKDVEKRFRPRVAWLVAEETVDQSLPWEKRQKLMQDKARTALPEIKAIKTADLLHQLVLFNDPDHKICQDNYFNTHVPERACWKFEQLLKALGTNWSHPLLDEAKNLLKKMEEKHLDK